MEIWMFGVLADLQSKIGSTSSYIDCYKSSCPKDWVRVPSILVAESRFELASSGTRKVSTIHQYGGLILGVAALYGVFLDSNTM